MSDRVDSDQDARPNRLISASSPYLLQHATNPVDWYPWGEEAFERARDEDRPIFLSIGYATCHWCHVMAHESFEDPAVAALINDAFIPVKLDREERPDVDAVYMTVCQLMTGHGGWPLTVVLTPDLRPFFAGTYFPRETRHGRIGMLELVPRLRGLWEERRDEIEESATHAVRAIREVEARSAGDESGTALDASTLRRAFEELEKRYDESRGGFGSAPKFPTPHNLLFLLRWHDRTGDRRPLEMVERTLGSMRRGGIFDHVGFGYHRYSTDARWLLPHFEKMLYDQALLAMACVETWEATRDDRYRRFAEEIFEYVRRDLLDPGGGFYSAEDADSEGREGAFYVWSRAELDEALESRLGADDAAFARDVFGVAARGNFADEATGRMTGENILHLSRPIERIAADRGQSVEEVEAGIERIRGALLDARGGRPRPLLDDKILADWNGLMIAALASAGRSFADPGATGTAERAARFVLDRMRDGDALVHRYREGRSGIEAGAADYAYMLWGTLELYAATLETDWLETSCELARGLVDRFWDTQRGGVYTSAAGVADVIVRQREIHDGATPSANATSWYGLLRLARLTGSAEWAERAEAIGAAFGGAIARAPSAHAMSLVALDLAIGPSHEVVIAGRRGAPDTSTLLSALRGAYRPRTSVLFRPAEPEDAERVDALAPFAAGHEPVDGGAAAYVCRDFACQRPTKDASEMLTLLG